MMIGLLTDDLAPAGEGFSVLNLLVILAVVAVGWPLYQALRRRLSRRRRERWARDGLLEDEGFTGETDPDLRPGTRDDTPRT